MRRIITLVALAAAGIAAYRVTLELRKPAAERVPWLRRLMNDQLNPWLLERHIPGSEHAEIGTLEHLGRKSGIVHHTPVHPTIVRQTVLIPAPLGIGSQWAQNVLHAGSARLQLHETLYELDQPELVAVAASGFYPARIAAPFDRMGWRYLRAHVAATAPGRLLELEPWPLAASATDGAIDEPSEIPIEHRMVARERVPA